MVSQKFLLETNSSVNHLDYNRVHLSRMQIINKTYALEHLDLLIRQYAQLKESCICQRCSLESNVRCQKSLSELVGILNQ